MDKEKYVTTADLARMLGVSRVSALKWMEKMERENKVKRIQLGRGFVIDKAALPNDLRMRLEEGRKDAGEALISASARFGKDIDFEKELWSAADRLRGNIDASEYKHIVLGLLFLKYVSDAYYHRRAELERRTADVNDKEFYIAEEAGRSAIVENKDQYKGAGVFYVPNNARWDHLRAHALHHDIGQFIDRAMEAIEEENPKQLKGVLPKIYTRSPLESHVLGELVNIFSRIQFDRDLDREKDILGRVYEYFLREFASAEGKRGGEFYTPRSIVRLMVEIMEPFENARVMDPACGSGGMFVQSSMFLKEHHKDPTRIAIFGQESNPTTWRLCRMNLAIRGIFGQIELGNTYYDDKFPDLRADFVLTNPPFNAEWEPNRLSDNDPRIKYGTPLSGSANFMWIQHFLHHLAPNGMAGFVMANGALAVGGKESEIRERMVKDDLVDVVVSCPAKMFFSVALPVSLWFLTKNKKGGRFGGDRTGKTLFIDARELATPISRRQVEFTTEHINKIADTVRAWRGQEGAGAYADIPGFCKSATLEEIAKNDSVLTPGRYVGVTKEEDDGVPFADKMTKLSGELERYFTEGKKLEGQIQENLQKLTNA